MLNIEKKDIKKIKIINQFKNNNNLNQLLKDRDYLTKIFLKYKNKIIMDLIIGIDFVIEIRLKELMK